MQHSECQMEISDSMNMTSHDDTNDMSEMGRFYLEKGLGGGSTINKKDKRREEKMLDTKRV